MDVAVNTPAVAPSAAGALARRLARGLLNPRLLALLLFVVIWKIASLNAPSRVVPDPLRVADVMWQVLSTGLFFQHLGISMLRIMSGFTGAVLLGIAVGVLMGSRRFWEGFFKDIVLIGMSLPGLIYALLAVMWFGLSLLAPMLAILTSTYPFVAVNVFEGVRAVDKELLDMAHVYRVRRTSIVRQVILPSLLPFILAGIRTGFAIAWKVSTITEVFGASSGVGYMIRNSFDQFSVRGMIAWALLFAGVMLAIEYGILVPVQNRLERWRPRAGQVV